MKRSNFSLVADNLIGIEGGAPFDLHNEGDFVGYEFDLAAKRLVLSWVLADEATGNQRCLQVVFEQVSWLRVSAAVTTKGVDAAVLSFMGYLHPDDAAQMNGYLDERESTESYHMIFRFENGTAIKVLAEHALAVLAPVPAGNQCQEECE